MEINTKYVTIAQRRGLLVTLGDFFVQDPPSYCNTFFFYTYWSLNVKFVDKVRKWFAAQSDQVFRVPALHSST